MGEVGLLGSSNWRGNRQSIGQLQCVGLGYWRAAMGRCGILER